MAAKEKLLIDNNKAYSEEEIIAHEELVKALAQDSESIWTYAIDTEYVKTQQANESGSWVIEDNQEALAEYMDDVSDVLLPEDIDTLDW